MNWHPLLPVVLNLAATVHGCLGCWSCCLPMPCLLRPSRVACLAGPAAAARRKPGDPVARAPEFSLSHNLNESDWKNFNRSSTALRQSSQVRHLAVALLPAPVTTVPLPHACSYGVQRCLLWMRQNIHLTRSELWTLPS